MTKLKFKTPCVKITAAQDELPSSSLANSQGVISGGKQINPSLSSSRNSRRVHYVPRFVIRVSVSVYICPASDPSNRFETRSGTREIQVPCYALTRTSAAEAKKVLSSKFSIWQIRVSLNGGALFIKKHYGESFSGCPDAEEDDDWVEEFQDFLSCVRRKSYNLGHNVIPVNLRIDTLKTESDSHYFDRVCSFTRERFKYPTFFGGFWKAMHTSFLCNGGEGNCPICLEDLNSATEDLSFLKELNSSGTATHLSLSNCSHRFHYCQVAAKQSLLPSLSLQV